MKKYPIMILILFLISIFNSIFLVQANSSHDWIIDGDKVYVDDNNVYISAEPHTVIESGWVTFTFISKIYSGDVDVCFGLNNSNMKPVKAQIWMGGKWTNLNKDFNSKIFEYKNFSKWYYAKDMPVNAGITYKLRIYLQIKYGSSGKYFFGIKRSIDNINQGYYIDPWWDSAFTKRQRLTINHEYINEDLYNFTVLVKVLPSQSAYCDNGDSIRFTDQEGVYSYSFEYEGGWNTSGTNYIWVKLPRVYSSQNTIFYMYFNNSEASSDEDIENTWDSNYSAVYHFSGTSCIDSTANNNDQDVSADVVTGIPGKVGNSFLFNQASSYIKIPSSGSLNITKKITITTLVDANSYDFSIACRILEKYNAYALSVNDYSSYSNQSELYLYPQYVRSNDNSVRINLWKTISAKYINDSSDIKIFTDGKDDTRDASGSGDIPINNNAVYIGNSYEFDRAWRGKIDEIRISNVTRSDTWINATYNTMNQTDGFMHYSTVEEYGGGVNAPSDFKAEGYEIDTIKLTFLKGENATHTYIRYDTDTYPTDRTEGYFLTNTPSTTVYHTVDDSSKTYYYSAWGYDSETGNYSTFYSVAQGTTLKGNLTINCYDFNTTKPLSFDVFVTDQQGIHTYIRHNCTNPISINVSDILIGNNIAIEVSANGSNKSKYISRWFFYNIQIYADFFINAYLAEENYTELYLISVIGQQGEYTSPPVEGAKIKFKRYIESAEKWENISILLTDANGQANIYLVPEQLYKVEISKSGYNTTYSDYLPSYELFTKTFRIYPIGYGGEEKTSFSETVTFNATMHNNKIYVKYTDTNAATIDTQIYIYEIYNNTYSLNHTDDRTYENTFSFSTSNINMSRTHIVKLYFNTTENYDINPPITITLNPYIIPGEKRFNFEDRMTSIFGASPIGWFNLLCVIMPLIILISFGVYNTGMAIIGAGLSMGLMEVIRIAWFTDTQISLYVFLIPPIIALGILYIWTKGRGEDRL